MTRETGEANVIFSTLLCSAMAAFPSLPLRKLQGLLFGPPLC